MYDTKPRVMNEQDQKVAEYLQAINVTFTVVHIGLNNDGFKGEKWWNDLWTTTFIRVSPATIPGYEGIQTKMVSSPYRTGIGHRWIPSPFVDNVKRIVGKSSRNYSYYLEQEVLQNGKVNKPTAASVLYSIILDMTILHENMTDFMTEMGMNPDSIRDVGRYNEWVELSKKYAAFFSMKEIEELHKLLEDY